MTTSAHPPSGTSSAATTVSTSYCPTRSSPPRSLRLTPCAEEMDRVYAMNLAMIRKAAQMTQVEVARKLSIAHRRGIPA